MLPSTLGLHPAPHLPLKYARSQLSLPLCSSFFFSFLNTFCCTTCQAGTATKLACCNYVAYALKPVHHKEDSTGCNCKTLSCILASFAENTRTALRTLDPRARDPKPLATPRSCRTCVPKKPWWPGARPWPQVFLRNLWRARCIPGAFSLPFLPAGDECFLRGHRV